MPDAIVVLAVAVPPVAATAVAVVSTARWSGRRIVAAAGIQATLSTALACSAAPDEAALPRLTVRDNHI